MRDLIWSIITAYCIGMCVGVIFHPHIIMVMTVEYFVLILLLCLWYGLTVFYIIYYKLSK
jgi:hypothetical protein